MEVSISAAESCVLMVFNEVSLGPVIENGTNRNWFVSTFHFYFSFTCTFYPFLWLVFLSAKITFLSLSSFIPSFLLSSVCSVTPTCYLLSLFSTFLLLCSFVFSIAKNVPGGAFPCLSALDKHRIPCETSSSPASFPWVWWPWDGRAGQRWQCHLTLSPAPFSCHFWDSSTVQTFLKLCSW